MIRLLVFASIWLLACCHTPAPRYVSDPGRGKGLPTAPRALVRLSDKLVIAKEPTIGDIDRALAALEMAGKLKQSNKFEVLWKTSRACFLMAGKLHNKQQQAHYGRKGRDLAGRAAILQEKRVEPHYYRALCIGRLAEATNKLKLIKSMMAEAEIAARLDSAFDDAGPLRFLGKVYITAPAWPVSVGSPEKAVDILRQAVTIAPVPLNRLFLGEALFHDEEYEEAAAHLQQALREGKVKGMEPRWREEGLEYLKRIEFKTATSPTEDNPLPMLPGEED